MLSTTEVILNESITTSPKAITLPDGVSADVCLIVATSSNVPVAWRLQKAVDSSTSILYPEGHFVRDVKLQQGATMFYAKTITGTATLEVEVLK